MGREAWERLEGEPSKAFAAFQVYLSMSRGERSIAAAYRQISGKPEAKGFPGYFGAWSGTWGWVERTSAYDDAQLALELKALEQQRIQARVDQARAGRKMREKGEELLTKTEDLNASHGADMIMKGQKVEALALGQSSEIGNPATHKIVIERVSGKKQSNEGGEADHRIIEFVLVGPSDPAPRNERDAQ